MTPSKYLPGPTVRAGLSWSLAFGLLVFMFLYLTEGAYLQAFLFAFVALVNVDLGRVQWAKRNEVAA